MDQSSIFLLQFVFSLVAWGITMGLVLGPQLAKLPRHEALLYLTLPHAFRHIGMSFLVPALNHEVLPSGFADPAAYGDLLAGVLALVALVALRQRWSVALGLVWMLSIVGMLDLANALRHLGVSEMFGATWFIPTMLVPLLLVTHVMSLRLLLARRATSAADLMQVSRP